MYECVCLYVCMYVCVYVCAYECVRLCVYECVRLCVYVCMYACMTYVCIYVCVSVYVCVYVCRCILPIEVSRTWEWPNVLRFVSKHCQISWARIHLETQGTVSFHFLHCALVTFSWPYARVFIIYQCKLHLLPGLQE